MKQIIYIIIGIILIGAVSATTNVSIGISSADDITVWANPNTPGDTTYILDGVDFKDTVQQLSDNDMKLRTVYYYLSSLFMKQDYKKDWFIVTPLKLDRYEQRFRWIMDNHYVPRTEVNDMIGYYDNKITDLELRILSLEKLSGEEDVLKARLNVAKEYNLPSLTYNGTKYTNVKDGFITIKPVKQIPKVSNTTDIEKPIDLHQRQIENWQRMCDNGMKKWCVILERGY